MKAIWEFKQRLHDLIRLKMLSKESTWLVIHDYLQMVRELKESPIEALKLARGDW